MGLTAVAAVAMTGDRAPPADDDNGHDSAAGCTGDVSGIPVSRKKVKMQVTHDPGFSETLPK